MGKRPFVGRSGLVRVKLVEEFVEKVESAIGPDAGCSVGEADKEVESVFELDTGCWGGKAGEHPARARKRIIKREKSFLFISFPFP
jgi:hypothetical protein